MKCPYMETTKQLIQDIQNIPLFMHSIPLVRKEYIDRIIEKYTSNEAAKDIDNQSQAKENITQESPKTTEAQSPIQVENVVQNPTEGQNERSETTDQLRNKPKEESKEDQERSETDQTTKQSDLVVVFFENGIEVKRGEVIKDRFDAWKSKV